MNRTIIYKVILLTALWIVLFERFNISAVILGLIISIGCALICVWLLPPSKSKTINIFRFIIYIFYLVGQVYLAGFNAIKFIFTGANLHVAQIKTKISNNFLRIILANSITLTPCTTLLEMEEDTFTVLYLSKKDSPPLDEGEYIKGKMERALIKAERLK